METLFALLTLYAGNPPVIDQVNILMAHSKRTQAHMRRDPPQKVTTNKTQENFTVTSY